MGMIFLVDNHDSFTYNLAQYFMELGAAVLVERSDAIGVDEVLESGADGIVISPGPGRPEGAGISLDLVAAAAGRIPLLGVCLGHQAIGQAFGARVTRAGRLMHGKTSWVRHDGEGVFEGLENPLEAMRYHSLVLDRRSLPPELTVTASSDEGEDEVVMAVRHKDFPRVDLEGIQFHPESILTPSGKRLLANFVSRLEMRRNPRPCSALERSGPPS